MYVCIRLKQHNQQKHPRNENVLKTYTRGFTLMKLLKKKLL